jgi:hypothetical protein
VKKLLAVPTSKHMCASCVCRRVARRSFVEVSARSIRSQACLPLPLPVQEHASLFLMHTGRRGREGWGTLDGSCVVVVVVWTDRISVLCSLYR